MTCTKAFPFPLPSTTWTPSLQDDLRLPPWNVSVRPFKLLWVPAVCWQSQRVEPKAAVLYWIHLELPLRQRCQGRDFFKIYPMGITHVKLPASWCSDRSREASRSIGNLFNSSVTSFSTPGRTGEGTFLGGITSSQLRTAGGSCRKGYVLIGFRKMD